MITIRMVVLTGLIVACGERTSGSAVLPTADSSATSTTSQEGQHVIHLADGGRMEGQMVDGKRTGTWTSYHPAGGIRSRSEYVDGFEEGATIVYHPNGMTMYTGAYLHGQPYGEWVYFGPNGNELKRVEHDSTGALVR